MKIRENYTCPLELTHDITKGKWKPILLWQIGKNNVTSFSGLKKTINDITEKMLMQNLDELLEYKLINKEKTTAYPLGVSYTLTTRGAKMLEAIIIMQEIGDDMLAEMNK